MNANSFLEDACPDDPYFRGNPLRYILMKEESEQLCKEIRRLSPKQQQMLVLFYLGEVSQGTLAQMFGSRKQTVSKHIQDGLRALRRMKGKETR